MIEKIYTVSQAAEVLQVHPNTIRNWIDKNQIPYFRLPSGHARIKSSDLEAITNANHQR